MLQWAELFGGGDGLALQLLMAKDRSDIIAVCRAKHLIDDDGKAVRKHTKTLAQQLIGIKDQLRPVGMDVGTPGKKRAAPNDSPREPKRKIFPGRF